MSFNPDPSKQSQKVIFRIDLTLIWWITIFSKLDKINKYFGLMIKIAYTVLCKTYGILGKQQWHHIFRFDVTYKYLTPLLICIVAICI